MKGSVSIKPRPSISVLLTAYKRQEFISYALESIANQQLSKDKFEVIIVKDFSDEKLDNRIKELGYKSFLYGGTVGEQLIFGIQRTKGNIISFLQDDDLFEPEKLNAVLKAFSENQKLVLMKNGFSIINSIGVNSKMPSAGGQKKTIQISEYEKRKTREISLLVKNGADFNLSCISIRKDVVLNYANQLQMIETGDDSFMFFISLFSSGDILIDSDHLNQYRVHNKGTILKSGSLEEMLHKNGLQFYKQIQTFKILLSISEETNVSVAIRKAIREGITVRMATLRIVAIDENTDYATLVDVIGLLFHHNTVKIRFLFKLILANLIVTLNRPLGREIYKCYITKYYDNILNHKQV